jgi:hypothetical protein
MNIFTDPKTDIGGYYIYIIYYQRWPLYLGLSVFWFLDPGTTCRIPGTICRVPGTIRKKHALY